MQMNGTRPVLESRINTAMFSGFQYACGSKKLAVISVSFPSNVSVENASKFEGQMNVGENIFWRVRSEAFYKVVCFLLFLGAILTRHALGDVGPMPIERETRQWLKESGLPDNSVTCLLQTRDKFLWVGTEAGLARFDGNEFRQVCDAAGDALKINCIYEDFSGLIWVGTQNRGLMVVSNGTLVSFQPQFPFLSGNITSLAQNRREVFWVGTSQGLIRIQNGSVTRFSTTNGLPDNYVSAIHSARSGALWVTTRKGMCEFREDRFVRMEFQTQGLGPNPEFLGVYEDDKTNVWAFGDTFLVNLKDGKRLNNFRGGDLASYRIWSLCERRDGGLWISTSGQGIFSFADGHFTPVAFRERMLSSDVRTVLEDDEGNIWLGTFGGGLIRMRQRSWQFLGESAGLPNEAASCVVASADGHLYAGFLRGGLFFGKPGRFDAVGRKSGFETENLVTSVCVASNSTLWIGTYGDGVYQLNENSVQHWTTANGLSDNVVSALCLDDWDGIWIGCRSGKLQRLDGSTISTFGKENGLPESPITCLKTAARIVLVGTEGGSVFQSSGTNFQVLPTPPQLQGKPIRALFEDSQARLWIGAADVGLTCVGADGARLFDAGNGFPDLDVRGIVEDLRRNIWVGTTKGIWQIRKGDASDPLPAKLNAQQLFAEATGLPGANLPGGPGAAATADGMLYFTSMHGIIGVNPRRWLANNRDLQVSLEQLFLNSSPLAIPTPPASSSDPAAASIFKLRSQIHSMEFRFTAVDLGFPEKLRFQHFLEGFESDWADNGNDRVVHYGRLLYGKYRFHLRVSRGDNVWHEMESPFAFQLTPPLWRSNGAMVLFGIISLGLIILGVRQISHRHLRRKMAQLAQQQAMEKERMRIAQNMHDEIGSKLTRISLISELVLSGKEPPGENLRSIATTSRKLLQALDEIVWAVNPQNDTVEYLATYLGYYADEYFQSTNILLELKIPTDLPHHPLSSETRHNLFLAFEEALGNVLKHSGATHVHVEMLFTPAKFTIAIRDNGRGFLPAVCADPPSKSPANGSKRIGNGLKNMRKRLGEIGGECQIESVPTQGTTVLLNLWLAPKSKKSS